MTTVTVEIDETDVTDLALSGSSTRNLNRPSTAQVTLPMQEAIGAAGSLLKIYLDGVLHHHGRVLLIETDASEDTGYTVYNSTDPLELWKWRPVRDDTGNFANPDIADLNGTTIDGPSMIEAIYDNSVNAGAGPPADAEGPLFLQKGTINYGTINVTGVPTDWPMTMAQLATLLVGTGETDIIITPIELTDSGFTCSGETIYDHARMDVYPGNYGLDLTTSVVFQYGTGLRNIRRLRWNEDMTNLCNKLWTYLGPKCDDQHWQANIVGTAGGIDNPTFWSECAEDTDDAVRWNDWHAAVVAAAGTDIGSCSPPDSRGLYGVRMDIKIVDALGDDAFCVPSSGPVGYCLHKKLWLQESWLRAVPQTLVHVTPTRDTAIGEFDIGDLILVEAAAAAVGRGGFTGAQRVYSYTVSWDTDSVPALSELQVSADQEGFN